MSRPNHCVYCLLRVDGDNFLHCQDCDKDVHITCLKRPGTPGDIVGDVFFEFRCSHCTDDGKEVFERIHLPWAMMVVMALHNLSVQSRGLSHHGFFHWRTHIACFIEKNWVYLIGGVVKKKKKWIGTISGTLSHNTPVMFLSGFNVFNEQGWWKLAHNMNPKQYMDFYMTQRTERMKQEKLALLQAAGRVGTAAESEVSIEDEMDSCVPAKRFRSEVATVEPVVFSRSLAYMGRTPWKRKPKEDNSIEADLAAFLSSNISNVDLNLDLAHIAGLTDDNESIASAGPPLIPTTADMTNTTLPVEWPDNLLDLDFLKTVDLMAQFEGDHNNVAIGAGAVCPAGGAIEPDSNAMFEPRIVQVTNFQAGERDYVEEALGSSGSAPTAVASSSASVCSASGSSMAGGSSSDTRMPFIKQEPIDETITPQTQEDQNHSDSEEEDYDAKYACAASLFERNPSKHRQPWLLSDATTDAADALLDADATGEVPTEPMSAYEEAETLRRLRHIVRSSDRRETAAMPVWVKRFYRKLCVRELKRTLGKPIFDIDELLLGGGQRTKGGGTVRRVDEQQVLDRYHHLVCGVNRARRGDGRSGATTLQARLAGVGEHEMFVSPHTGRVLHPFVYRNAEQMPQWVKLMAELQYTVNGKMPTRATIDYCYVRPHHIAAVNGLLQKTFWPGIDMSECLSYPEFSIVALYKRLVVGCAFGVPDVGHNDAYISFMAVRPGWQRAGIASFMLYHLTQTCMGKDITLHVSATNAAICLYQKFGFKIEEVILDFYDKYLPIDSPHSRHAFFLRMKR